MSWSLGGTYDFDEFVEYVQDPTYTRHGGPNQNIWSGFADLWDIWEDANVGHYALNPEQRDRHYDKAKYAWKVAKGTVSEDTTYDDWVAGGGGDYSTPEDEPPPPPSEPGDPGRDWRDVVSDINDVVTGYGDDLEGFGDFEYSGQDSLGGLQDLLGDIGGLGEWNEETGEWEVNEDLLNRPDLETYDARDFYEQYGYKAKDYEKRIRKLSKLLAGGPDIEGGQDYAAGLAGYDDWEGLSAGLKEYRQRMENVSFDQPLTDEQQRTIGRNVAMMEDEMAQIQESLGLESFGRSMHQAGMFRSEVSNYRLQEEMAYAEYNLTKAFKESEAYADQFYAMSEQAGTNVVAFDNMRLSNAMGAMEGYSVIMARMADTYATEVGRVLGDNQSAIALYNSDIAALTGHADIVYNSIIAHLGFYEQEYAIYSEDFTRTLIALELALQPYAIELESIFTEQGIGAEEQAQAAEDLSGILSGVLTVIGGVLGTIALPGAGTAAGAAAGGLLADFFESIFGG